MSSVENGSSAHKAAAGSSQARNAELRREKRRVPKDLRQRNEMSCDRCKQRKIRCIRADEGDACRACQEAALECESTLPRKQRLYASIEQLSTRYRVMDSILRAQFPEFDLDSVSGVLSLANEKGVDVPQEDGSIVPLDPTKLDLPTKGLPPPELRPFLSSHAVPLSTDQMSGIFKIPEGSLVPAPRGGYHYVGPASLAVFAKHVRELVSKCDLTAMLTFDDTGVRRFLKAAEFTTSRTSQAIEARIEGHPATAAAEEEDAPGTVDSTGMSGLNPNAPFHNGTSFMNPPSASPAASSPRSTLKLRRLLEVLPEKSLSDTLVRGFFDRVHPNFTIFHRLSFQMKYELLWAKHQRQPQAEAEPGWICALYMIYVLGAQALETESVLSIQSSSIQQRFLALVMRDGLSRLALTASLANVQALMLLSLYQHNAGERNAAWMLLGQAARTAVALGMHRDGQNGNFDPFERNTRRMVWWVLHMFEQTLSFALGRPSNTDLIDTSAVLPEETFVDGSDLPPGYFERAVALTELCARIKRFTASIASDYEDPTKMTPTVQTARHLFAQIRAWKEDLPKHFAIGYHFATSKHQRAVVLLHILSDHLKSQVGRSYLLCRVNHTLDSRTQASQPLPPQIQELAQLAVDGAKAVAENLIHLAKHRILEGSVWLDFYYVHHAAFIFGIEFLAKPSGYSPREQQDRKLISELLGIAQGLKLAPTYRILMNIALQLAYVVGIGPEDDSASTQAPLQLNNMGSAGALNQGQLNNDGTYSTNFNEAGGIAGPSSQPFEPQLMQPNLSNLAAMHSTFGQNHPTGSDQNLAFPQNYQSSYNTLEHLFGPMPPSQHNSPPDLFADLYNFGLDTTASNPWDFFNIGTTAEGLIHGLQGLDQVQNSGSNQQQQ